MKPDLLLGIDIGTYESKGVVSTPEGKVLASASTGHELSMPEPGWVEHDAEKIWWGDFVKLCKNLLSQQNIEANRIAGVAVSAIAPCVLPLDNSGQPLRPGILYGVDTRASREIEELESKIGIEEIFNSNGLQLSSHAAGPKILWIRKNEPRVWEKTDVFLTGSGYLVYKLTGEQVIDIYTAFAYAPLFNVQKNEWNSGIAEYIVPLDRLPRLLWSTDIAGAITREASSQTGLIMGTPVTAGTSDAAAEALSAGLSTPGDLMLMYGSSQFFLHKTNRLVSNKRFWGHAFLEPDTYAFTAGMSTSGSITRWFRDNFAFEELTGEKELGRNAYEELASLASNSPPGAKGLVLLPYFSGERSPVNDPQAVGLLIGLTLRHTRADVYRAILEGIGFGIRHNLEVMGEQGVHPNRILAVGGGTKNPLWLKIVSDIAGIEQYVPDQAFGAAYGNAYLAGVGIGLFPNTTEIEKWINFREVVKPESQTHLRYQKQYQLYKQLYLNNADTMHQLSLLQQTR